MQMLAGDAGDAGRNRIGRDLGQAMRRQVGTPGFRYTTHEASAPDSADTRHTPAVPPSVIPRRSMAAAQPSCRPVRARASQCPPGGAFISARPHHVHHRHRYHHHPHPPWPLFLRPRPRTPRPPLTLLHSFLRPTPSAKILSPWPMPSSVSPPLHLFPPMPLCPRPPLRLRPSLRLELRQRRRLGLCTRMQPTWIATQHVRLMVLRLSANSRLLQALSLSPRPSGPPPSQATPTA